MMEIIKGKSHVIIVIIIVLVIVYAIYYFFYNTSNLPEGDLIESIKSPTDEYKLNSYFINGGSLSGDAIRVELTNNKTSKRKNIYWGYPESTANIKWINEDTVEINGHTLNIHKDRYDWRKHR